MTDSESRTPLGEPPATHPFRSALARRDFASMREALSPDVVLHSPILNSPFVGPAAVLELFEVITQTVEDVRFTVDVAHDDMRVMSWHARVGGIEVEGADILRLDEFGRIREFTVFFRPLSGVTALTEALGKRLARRRSRARGWLASVLTAPLALVGRATDRVAPHILNLPAASTTAAGPG